MMYRLFIVLKALPKRRWAWGHQLNPSRIEWKISAIGGKFNGKDFDGSFTRTITTQRLAEQPQSINIVLGESYGLWPFLAEYNEPGAYLVEQGRKYATALKRWAHS